MVVRDAIIKLFHEEPFFLEPLPPDEEPDARRRSTELGAIDALLPGDFSERAEAHAEDDLSADALDRPRPYYRLYVAATDLASGRVGATAIRRPGVWAAALVAALDGLRWWTLRQDRVAEIERGELESVLVDPGDVTVVVASLAEPQEPPLRAVAEVDRREGGGDLKRLLEDAGAVLLREPAHDGYDWSIFAAGPLRERLAPEIASRLGEGTRAFTVPFQKARSEERFYFEQWALEKLPDWVEEIQR